MSDDLRSALERTLENLPTFISQFNDEPVQALPKAALLDLLAKYPAKLPLFVAAIDAIEIGAGSEHFKHGRETMRDDAISAIQDLIHKPQVQS